jgi:hypothetical protein
MQKDLAQLISSILEADKTMSQQAARTGNNYLLFFRAYPQVVEVLSRQHGELLFDDNSERIVPTVSAQLDSNVNLPLDSVFVVGNSPSLRSTPKGTHHEHPLLLAQRTPSHPRAQH